MPTTIVARIHLSSADSLDNTDFARYWVIAQNDSFADLPFGQLVVILKVIRVVLLLLSLGCPTWHKGICTTWLHLLQVWLELVRRSCIELVGHVLDPVKEHLGLGVAWIDHVLHDTWVHCNLLHHVG